VASADLAAAAAAEAAAAATVAKAAEVEWFRRKEPMGKRWCAGPAEVRAYVEAHDGVLPREVKGHDEQRRLAMIMKGWIRRKDTIPDVWEGCEPLETEWFRRKALCSM
jgi:hypothetical protein